MNKRIRYVAVCVNGEHMVTSVDVIKEYRELENGFMIRWGPAEILSYTPYFYQNKDLQACWRFANNARQEQRHLQSKQSD